jgi:hypothetical protein
MMLLFIHVVVEFVAVAVAAIAEGFSGFTHFGCKMATLQIYENNGYLTKLDAENKKCGSETWNTGRNQKAKQCGILDRSQRPGPQNARLMRIRTVQCCTSFLVNDTLSFISSPTKNKHTKKRKPSNSTKTPHDLKYAMAM